jgi:hypothetical protein
MCLSFYVPVIHFYVPVTRMCKTKKVVRFLINGNQVESVLICTNNAAGVLIHVLCHCCVPEVGLLTWLPLFHYTYACTCVCIVHSHAPYMDHVTSFE